MSPASHRLIACLEAFSHEEDRAALNDDWPALAALLERELALATRLADQAGPTADEALAARAGGVLRRHAALARRMSAARESARGELAELDQARRRVRAVRGAYAGACPENAARDSGAADGTVAA